MSHGQNSFTGEYIGSIWGLFQRAKRLSRSHGSCVETFPAVSPKYFLQSCNVEWLLMHMSTCVCIVLYLQASLPVPRGMPSMMVAVCACIPQGQENSFASYVWTFWAHLGYSRVFGEMNLKYCLHHEAAARGLALCVGRKDLGSG